MRAEILRKMLELGVAAYSEDGRRVVERLTPEAEADIAAALEESSEADSDPRSIGTVFEEARWRR